MPAEEAVILTGTRRSIAPNQAFGRFSNQYCQGERLGVYDEHLPGQITSSVNQSREQTGIHEEWKDPSSDKQYRARRGRVRLRRVGFQP